MSLFNLLKKKRWIKKYLKELKKKYLPGLTIDKCSKQQIIPLLGGKTLEGQFYLEILCNMVKYLKRFRIMLKIN